MFKLLAVLFTLSFHATSAFAATGEQPQQLDDARYTGTAVCAGCHAEEFKQWQGSHHDLAMQPANDETVLGDFNNAVFEHNGMSTTFFKKDGKFWVNTDGPDGKMANFQVSYVFGVTPLQQYLVPFPDGRMQTLSISWDSRSEADGGQRWFHLYPDTSGHTDVLHWTHQAQNWNARCAECHSTNLQKNYDPANNSYATTWFEIDVSCESCHGPGKNHVNWASQKTKGNKIEHYGFDRQLSAVGEWQRDASMSTAKNIADESLVSNQLDSCFSCHSRRSTIDFNKAHSGKQHPLDSHQLRLLEAPLYYPDGQIRDEVYVYGSFIQSKMHQNGVVCSNCHNPHSLSLKTEGNLVCAQCHNPDVFDQPNHHHHKKDSAGAQCANCHMPETTYMTVDPRRDHSMRIPRPDLSKALQTPNACTQCHSDKTVDWSLASFRKWYPERLQQPHFGRSLALAQQGATTALPQLAALINDESLPAMIRASAVQQLQRFPNQYSLNNARVQLSSDDPLIRFAAVQVFEMVPRPQRKTYLWPLLDDPIKTIRFEATRLLVGLGINDGSSLGMQEAAKLSTAVDNYLAAVKSNADSPAGQMQLGILYQALNNFERAEAAYQQALVLEPNFIPALLNSADLYRQRQQDAQALPLLQRALQIDTENISSNYSMGLLLIRLKKLDEAVKYLEKVAALAPEVAHYSYVYAVALFESGKKEWAITALKRALERHPQNTDIISALAGYLNAMGRSSEAQKYASQLPRPNR